MTPTEILALSDDDLLMHVATKVMPKNWRVAFVKWNPLKSWDDCWTVVRVMEAKGHYFTRNRFLEKTAWFCDSYCGYDGDERRAILLAALMAMQGGE